MGIEGFLVSSSLIGVLAQRLVRVICPVCKEEYKPEQDIIDKAELIPEGMTAYHGVGCNECRHTGYRGRTGIFELMVIDRDTRRLILERASSDVIRQKVVEKGMTVLRDSGWEKVREGVTSIEEVLRVSQEGI
jgi:type IV pilus assembly protein PilB